MTIYKISYVVLGAPHPGAIMNATTRPEVGEIIELGDVRVQVVEVVDLLPSRGNFQYLHVTCRAINAREQNTTG